MPNIEYCKHNIFKNQKFSTNIFGVLSIWSLSLHFSDIVRFSAFSCFADFYLISNKTESICATCFIFWHTKWARFVSRWRKWHVYTIITFWAITIQSIAAKDGTPCTLLMSKLNVFCSFMCENPDNYSELFNR